MTVKISSTARETMLALAAADPGHEVCGLLFGKADRIDVASPTRNVAADTRTSFEIDPAVLIAALRAERDEGATVSGYFHSHPNGLGSPSATDAMMAVHDDRIWLIIADHHITGWRDSPSGFVRLTVI
ncbi:MAG: family peptidase [Sphingomonadales bacterium]|nr:family peptidase [Sphingomonadales bacterium]